MSEKKNKLISRLTEIETRWFEFTVKLEQRMKELVEASVPELKDLYQNDKDHYKSAYYNLLNGIVGQLNSIQEKADEVEEANVSGQFDKLEDRIESMDDDELSDFFDKLRDRCSERADQLEAKVDHWIEKVKECGVEDFEVKYQEIMDEYNLIKDKFCCKQCGSPVALDRIYFITTHITCPSCQTQNTFEPSSRAGELDHVGLQLAEQRTYPLLNAYEKEEDKEREIYDKIHVLEIEKIGCELAGNENRIAEIDSRIAELERARKECIANAPGLYETYLKAKFEEWIRLVPELEEQNRKVYESWLSYFRKKNVLGND